jgi:hypothetical protein
MNESKRSQLITDTRGDPALWRAEAWAAYAQVSDELERARGRADTRRREIKTEIKIVQGNLDAALLAMAPHQRSTGGGKRVRRALAQVWLTLKRYYSGSSIERTWAAIHRASEALYMLYDDGELLAHARRLHELLAALPDLSSQMAALNSIQPELESEAKGTKIQARSMLRELYQEAMGVSDSLQIEARVLRNTLLITSATLFSILVALGLAHMFDTSILSVCSEVKKGETLCPAGNSSQPLDVFAIELAGMLGGALSMVIPIATGERIKTPFRVFNHQLLLKIFAGAATGFAGVVLVQSGLISELNVTSESAIIGYAIFFGFSQQALTGVIDRHASSLAKETPTAKSV